MLIPMQQRAMGLNEIVGSNVKRKRQAAGWSQAELAERLAAELGKAKIDPTTITRMESGARPTTVAEIDALGRVFGVSFKEFIDEEDERLTHLRDRVAIVEVLRQKLAETRAHLAMEEKALSNLLSSLTPDDYARNPGELATAIGLAKRLLDDSET